MKNKPTMKEHKGSRGKSRGRDRERERERLYNEKSTTRTSSQQQQQQQLFDAPNPTHVQRVLTRQRITV
jgi:hypothetical protein